MCGQYVNYATTHISIPRRCNHCIRALPKSSRDGDGLIGMGVGGDEASADVVTLSATSSLP